MHSPQPWEMKQKGPGQSRRRRAWFHPALVDAFGVALALVADRSGMAMQAQDRRDASETLFTRVGSGHGHLQTACAMLEGANMFCRIASRLSRRTRAVSDDLAQLHILYHESPQLIIVDVRAVITDNENSKDDMLDRLTERSHPVCLCRTVTSRKSSISLQPSSKAAGARSDLRILTLGFPIIRSFDNNPHVALACFQEP